LHRHFVPWAFQKGGSRRSANMFPFHSDLVPHGLRKTLPLSSHCNHVTIQQCNDSPSRPPKAVKRRHAERGSPRIYIRLRDLAGRRPASIQFRLSKNWRRLVVAFTAGKLRLLPIFQNFSNPSSCFSQEIIAQFITIALRLVGRQQAF
jgi:hypothetical protein